MQVPEEQLRLVRYASAEVAIRVTELWTGLALSGDRVYEMDARGYHARRARLRQLTEIIRPNPDLPWWGAALVLSLLLTGRLAYRRHRGAQGGRHRLTRAAIALRAAGCSVQP